MLLVFKLIIIFNRQESHHRLALPGAKTKDAQKDLVMPKTLSRGVHSLRRSLNEQEGLEFSYVWWMHRGL